MRKTKDNDYRADCHFRSGKGKKDCAALNSRQCEGCSFYKTDERFFHEHEKAMEKLYDHLSLGQLEGIKKKYRDTWKEMMGV